MFSKSLITFLLLTVPSLVVSDFIEIVDWDVTRFESVDDDTNTTEIKGVAYAGEDVTWTYDSSTYNVVQFDNSDDYEACAIENATVVDTTGSYTISTWPFNDMKGNHYFASGLGSDCEDGKKIKIQVKPKQFEGNKKKSCQGVDGATATVITGNAVKGFGKCLKKCTNTKDCFGFQWTFKREGSTKLYSCTMYDVYPEVTGPKLQGFIKAMCQSVKYDNYDDNSED